MNSILKVREDAFAVIATLDAARFDLTATEQLRTELGALNADSQSKPLLLDLEKVEFMPSATLGALVEIANECRKRNRRLALIGLQPKLADILRVCALDKVFTICQNENEAKASF